MWLVIRLIVALLAALVRIFARARKQEPAGELNGRKFYRSLAKTKSGAITGFRLGIALDSKIVFDLHPESATDRLCKGIGLSEELQTGEASFDRRIYVACDHLGFHELLKESAAAREAAVAILAAGFTSIRSDGSTIWAQRSESREPVEADYAPLIALAEALASLEQDDARRALRPNRFAVRFLIVEVVVWSIVGLAFPTYLQMRLTEMTEYFEIGRLLLLSGAAAALLFALILGMIVLFLRGSSRGHRIVIESAIVLLIALPISGFSIVSDLNTNLKSSRAGAAPVTLECGIVSKEKVTTKSRRSRSTSYYLDITPPVNLPPDIDLPRRMRVSWSEYHEAMPKGTMVLVIDPGGLDIPWISSRTFRSAPADAPKLAEDSVAGPNESTDP